MSLKDKGAILTLKYIGEDYWSRPVYQDQFGHLWKDIELGQYGTPVLCSSVGDEFEGEPDTAIKQAFKILPAEGRVSEDKRFQYQMLDRLKSDCDYYLGYGRRNSGCLWAKEVKGHIDHMKAIWSSFSEDEKPEWLTWEQILDYEREMCEK